MPVGLQGGAEFGPRCREMDTELLELADLSGIDGPVVVVALASSPGHDHDHTVSHAVAYYESLGASDVVGAPDARDDPVGARTLVEGARMVVLPGGSPRRLLTSLREARLDVALRAVLARGGVVSGASAGAMVACAWTLLPESGTPELVAGIGLVPRTLVLPHFSGDLSWLDAVRSTLAQDVVVLGLPECAGVVVGSDAGERVAVRALGAAGTDLFGAVEAPLAVGSSTAY
jgi:cyanophycinase-like exopeptidase